MLSAPHGALCARILPFATRTNIAALKKRNFDCNALKRYAETARLATGDPGAEAEDLAELLEKLCAALDVQGLASWGLNPDKIPEAVAKARRASSMKSNPVELDQPELTGILESAL
jgi:alcohol dehydrogenase class IV